MKNAGLGCPFAMMCRAPLVTARSSLSGPRDASARRGLHLLLGGLLGGRTEVLRRLRDRASSPATRRPSSTSSSLSASSASSPLHPLLGLDLGDALAATGRRRRAPCRGSVDLLLDDVLELTEVGRHVHVEALRELGDLGLGLAHLQLGVVLGDLLADLDQLLVRVLDLLEVVPVGRLVQRELLLRSRRAPPSPSAARARTWPRSSRSPALR